MGKLMGTVGGRGRQRSSWDLLAGWARIRTSSGQCFLRLSWPSPFLAQQPLHTMERPNEITQLYIKEVS